MLVKYFKCSYTDKINEENQNACMVDGLVEKFNTLISMIAKSCDVRDKNWDVRLPYLLLGLCSMMLLRARGSGEHQHHKKSMKTAQPDNQESESPPPRY